MQEMDPQRLIDDLRTLLMEGKITKQDELCAELQAKGHQVNQSKMSRLIRKLNAIKSKNEDGQVVYRLTREPAPPLPSSRLSDLMIDVNANETTIIVTTSPGAAQVVARILDFHQDKMQILGTIAGDDTVFVAPSSIKTIQDTYLAIRKLLF